MSSYEALGVNYGNVGQFDAGRAIPHEHQLDQRVRTGIRGFLKGTIAAEPQSTIGLEAVQELVEEVVDYEAVRPLYSAQPFRYPAVSNLSHMPGYGAESTVVSAVSNMRLMTDRFGQDAFAATAFDRRKDRAITWGAILDDDYELRIRGGSGAGTFSIDLGLGVIDRTKNRPVYRELWRAGIDTVHDGESMGTRFIRTGSGLKRGDVLKQQTFHEFRHRNRILPQRLLGIIGLYVMREFEPDYALALSTDGAKRLSTLGRSSGECDYTGIFGDIGFSGSDSQDWLLIPDFANNFYTALERADIKKHESHRLHEAAEAIQEMTVVPPVSTAEPRSRLFRLCSDDSRQTLERELAIALPPAA